MKLNRVLWRTLSNPPSQVIIHSLYTWVNGEGDLRFVDGRRVTSGWRMKVLAGLNCGGEPTLQPTGAGCHGDEAVDQLLQCYERQMQDWSGRWKDQDLLGF